jgi:hypothetical protein
VSSRDWDTRATRAPRSKADREAEAAIGKVNERFIAGQVASWLTSETGTAVAYEENLDPYASVDGWLVWNGSRRRLLEAKARTPMRVPDGFYRVEVQKMHALQREGRDQWMPSLLAYGFADRIEVLRLFPTAESDAKVAQLARAAFSERDEAYLVPFEAWITVPVAGWVVDPNPFTR